MSLCENVVDILRGLGCPKCDDDSVKFPRKVDIKRIEWRYVVRGMIDLFVNEIYICRVNYEQANLLYSLFKPLSKKTEPVDLERATINKAREKIGIGPVPEPVEPANSHSDILRSCAEIVDELRQHDKESQENIFVMVMKMLTAIGDDSTMELFKAIGKDVTTKDEKPDGKKGCVTHAIHTGFVTADLEPIVIEKEKGSGLFFVYVACKNGERVPWKPEGGPNFEGGKTAEEAKEWFDKYPKDPLTDAIRKDGSPPTRG